MDAIYRQIYRVIARIPRGRVATYGLIADLAGIPGHARQVGYALRILPPGGRLAWHRVVNARGEISPRRDGGCGDLQRSLLESEGIVFDDRGRLSLAHYGWRPLREGTRESSDV